MNPDDLRYTEEHEWTASWAASGSSASPTMRRNSATSRISSCRRLTYRGLREVAAESVKAASDIYAPVLGPSSRSTRPRSRPELVNKAPMAVMVFVEEVDATEFDALMDISPTRLRRAPGSFSRAPPACRYRRARRRFYQRTRRPCRARLIRAIFVNHTGPPPRGGHALCSTRIHELIPTTRPTGRPCWRPSVSPTRELQQHPAPLRMKSDIRPACRNGGADHAALAARNQAYALSSAAANTPYSGRRTRFRAAANSTPPTRPTSRNAPRVRSRASMSTSRPCAA